MAQPLIQIDQAGQPPGTPGQSRDDLVSGVDIVFTAPVAGAGSYQWRLLDAPSEWAGAVTGANTDTFTITDPGDHGTFLVELVFNGRSSGKTNQAGYFESTQGGAAIKMPGGTRRIAALETLQFHPTEGAQPALDDALQALDALRGFSSGTWTPEDDADAVIAPGGTEAARFRASDQVLALADSLEIGFGSRVHADDGTFEPFIDFAGTLEMGVNGKAVSFITGSMRMHHDIAPVLPGSSGLGKTSAGFDFCYLAQRSVKPSTPAVGEGCIYLFDNAGALELRVLDDDGTEYKATLTAV